MKDPDEHTTSALSSSCYALCNVRHTMARYMAVGTRLTSVYSAYRCGVEIRNLSLLDVTAVSAI